MSSIKKYFAVVLLAAVSAVGLYGCGGDTPTATPAVSPPTATAVPPAPTNTVPPPPSPTTASSTGITATGPAAELLSKSLAAMKTLKSVHITTTIGSSLGAAITGSGDSELPNKSRYSLTMGALGQIETITIDNQSYSKLPGQDAYVQSTGDKSFMTNLGGITDPQVISSFSQIASTASIAGDETVNGASTTHIKFTYDADKAQSALSGQAGVATPVATPAPGMGLANGDIWIDKSTNYVRRLKFVTPLAAAAVGGPGANATPGPGETPGAASNTSVEVTYSKFNEPVVPPIVKPTNITTLPGVPTP